MKASAQANANIALSKYWGKRDKKLMLPQNSSLSMTTEGMFAHTTVEFDPKYTKDSLVLNDEEFVPGTKEFDDYVGKFMKVVREMTDNTDKVKIVSKNNFPTAAGLASSAAGFAALATAINEALGLNLEKKELSMLARRGSGSATRSIHGGFVYWHKGERDDGTDSFAEQIVDENYWPEFRMIACVTSKKAKKVKSRAGMAQTVETSPLYRAWLETVSEDINNIKRGILERDFSLVGKTAELNALKMHSTMITTTESIIYWNAVTLEVMHAVMDFRKQGIDCYFTIDGGPQVKILCQKKDFDRIIKTLKKIHQIEELYKIGVGKGSEIVNRHLF